MILRSVRVAACASAMIGMGISGAAAETKLVFGTFSTPTNTLTVHGFEAWFKDVEKRTNGSVVTDIIAGGSLVQAKTGLAALNDGLVDSAYTPTIYYPAELPASTLFGDLAVTLSDAKAATAATIETILFDCPDCLAEYKKWNMHYFGAWNTTPYDLLCNKEVKSAEDIRNLRIRTSGAYVGIITALGATSTNVAITEIYEMMQRGQLDCTVGQPNWLVDFSLGDVAKYVIDVNAGFVAVPTLLNLREQTWQKLTKEEQQAFVDAAPMAVAGATYGYIDADRKALEGNPDYKVITPDQSLLDGIAAALPDQGEIIAKAEQKGVKGAAQIVENYLASYEKWKKLTAEIEDTPDAYAELLRQQIYSRYPMDM